MTPSEFAEVLDALRDRAAGLRAVGVREFVVGDIRVTLAAPEPLPDVSFDDDKQETSPILDPLDDPETYGRLSGVPGFSRHEE